MADKTAKRTQETEESVDQAPNTPEIDSKYRLIILAAQRSKQLQRGAQSRVDIDTRKHKPTRVALKEIEGNRVDFSIDDDTGSKP